MLKLRNELRNGGAPPPAFVCGMQRMLTAVALADRNPRAFLQRAWPDDETAALLLRAVSTPTTSTTYPTYTSAATLPASPQRPQPRGSIPRAVQIDLSGIAQVNVPRGATQPQPGFIPEGAAAPLAQFSLAAITVGPAKKILILSALTGELANATADTPHRPSSGMCWRKQQPSPLTPHCSAPQPPMPLALQDCLSV